MPPQTTEVRCPTCSKLLLGLSADFEGHVATKCHRCKAEAGYPDLAVPDRPLTCLCGRWLARGVVRAGHARIKCRTHRALVLLTPTAVLLAEVPRAVREIPPSPEEQDQRLVQMIEARWQGLRQQGVRRSVEIAVGLRFDVFNRDGFRCRYCGRGPEQGVFLEADHVLPRSAGGKDALANLVTACWDCNRGKAAKRLDRVS